MFNLRRPIAFTCLALLATVVPALAGPPLLCHPFDIGAARSLPWDGSNSCWQGRADYNLQNLVSDTEALLTPATPVVVRMETLRRAALYASLDGKVASRLLSTVTECARAAERRDPSSPATASALFDAGYLTATLKQITQLGSDRQFASRARTIAAVIGTADGLNDLHRSITMRPDDGGMRFGAALVASTADRVAYREHADKARKSAAQDRLLAKNIDKLG